MDRKLTVILLGVIAFTAVGSAETIVNTQDWREASVAYNYGLLDDQDVRVVNNLGEARITPELLDQDSSHLVLESETAITDLEGFLNSEGLTNTEKVDNFNMEDGSHTLFERSGNEVKGFVVANPENVADTVSTFPKLNDGYWLIYYDQGRTEEILNQNSDKEVLFYGEFLTKPWKRVSNDYEVIDNETAVDRNYELAGNLLAENNDRGIQGSSGRFVEEGIATSGNINLIIQDSTRAYNFLNENNVEVLQIIGPDSGALGSEIRSTSGGNITVLVKTGRTFTGNPQLSGQEVPLQTLAGRPVSPDINLVDIIYDSEEGLLEFTFENTGSEPGDIVFTAAEIEGPNGESFNLEPENPDGTVLSGSKLKKTFNWTEEFVPQRADLLLSADGGRFANEDGSTTFNVTEGRVVRSQEPDVTIESVRYDNSTQRLEIKIRNNEERNVSVSGILQNFTVDGKPETNIRFDEQTVIEAKSTETLSKGLYMSASDLEENKDRSISLTLGSEKGVYQYQLDSNIESIEVEEEGSNLTVILILLVAFIVSGLGYVKREEIKELVNPYLE
ncbi:MAG: hypothetical protein V5A72_01515 [Candidatus Nanohaloarchaea archaeon]